MASDARRTKEYGVLYRAFLDQNCSSDIVLADIEEHPVHPTERTIAVRTLCNVRKYKLALGTCAQWPSFVNFLTCIVANLDMLFIAV
jgi:hypothetical protein